MLLVKILGTIIWFTCFSDVPITLMAAGGRVVVVTGANKGIGFCIAKQLIESRQFGRVLLAVCCGCHANIWNPLCCLVHFLPFSLLPLN